MVLIRLFFALAALVITAAGSSVMVAQTLMLEDIKMFDKTSGKSVKASKPSTISQEQSIVFPSTIGTTGQLLSISSVSGSTVNLGWQTIATGSASLSDRRATADTYTPSSQTPTGLSVNVLANKVYRIVGIVLANRVDAGVTKSDSLRLKLEGPSNTSRVSISVRCYDCPTSSRGVPSFKEDTTSVSVTTGIINPSGGGANDFTKRTYGIEGMLHTGASDGVLTLKVLDEGGSNDVTMDAESYILLTEID